jgi:predicted ester cyclase
VSIPQLSGRDIAAMLAPQGPRRQPMAGFDADYADIVDYIIRCTHRIWEQKDIGLIETHYADDIVMHLMTGPIHGADGVVANTIRTLSAFPDRTLMGEAVIWCDKGDQTYLSSHRITSSGTNLGPSDFGPATGRRVQFTTIADCLCRANEIVEEWLVRDNSAMVLGLGLSPRLVARGHADADRAAAIDGSWRAQAIDAILSAPATPFPHGPLPAPEQPHDFAHALFDQLWNHRRLGRVRDAWSPAAHAQMPGGRLLFGHGEITGWAIALLGAFGDARFRVDHVAAVPADGGSEIAVRWSMAGTHDGNGLYGAPSGRRVYILGVTHWHVSAGRILDEVTVFDEIALLRQIEGGL